MTEQDPSPQHPTEPGSDERTPAAERAPQTGHGEVDAALTRVQNLQGRPVQDHHDLLAGVHEQLHQVLNEPTEQLPRDRG